MAVIFVNRYFHPDHSATSQMLSGVAFGLAAAGHEVRVVTSRQRYDAPADRLPSHETIEGVEVTRVWTSSFGRANLVGRAVDYLSFYLTAALAIRRLTRPGDIVVAKTDPPMMSVLAAPMARSRGAYLVNWLQDLFPEVAEGLGMSRGAGRGLVFGALRRLRDRSLRAARFNVVLGERMAARLSALGIPQANVRLIPNWADGRAITPVPADRNGLRQEWGLADRFVVAYSGNLGRAHDAQTMLEAIAITEQAGRPQGARQLPIAWLFIGGGAQLDHLRRQVETRALQSVIFKPYQPQELLAESLSAADVHLVSLRPELEGLIVPSKLYGIAAAGRASLFIGDGDGEIARILARHNSGVTVAQGDGKALAAAVMALAQTPERCASMGAKARAAFDEDWDKTIAVQKWNEMLIEAGAEPAAALVPRTAFGLSAKQ